MDTKHHLIVAHEVTNVGSDRSQFSHMAKKTKVVLGTETLAVVCDRGDFNSEEILACKEDGIAVTLPKPLTSGNKAKGRFAKRQYPIHETPRAKQINKTARIHPHKSPKPQTRPTNKMAGVFHTWRNSGIGLCSP